ncbi:MAG: right-handed parallel beta-helix repeat-containing protein [Candidatus Paceibacterota bacterium]|jgi:pimeloyl-ACP methyl ester carboxylesterase
MKHIITIFAILFFAPSFVFASTTVSGTLSGNTTWSTGNTYIVSDMTVPTGVILTIEHGAIIKLNGGWDRISVLGTLNANGTDSDPIYFTSINDNSVGGSTGNGNPNISDWAHIVVLGGGTATFDHSIIRYGGANYTGTNIYNSGGTLSISNSEISRASIYGVYHTSGTTSIENSSIHDNVSYGVYGTGPGNITMNGNTFSNNSNSAGSFNFGSGLVVRNSGNSASGSGLCGFVMGGSLTSSQHWTKEGLAYIISDLTVPIGGDLSIDAGAVIKFRGGWDRLSILGSINANGTAGDPIYFTSIKDDIALGDTNGDNGDTTPSISDWAHIVVLGGGVANFNHSIIRYGGANYTGANVYNSGGNLSVSNSTISRASIYGVYHTSGTTSIGNSAINSNVSYGVYGTGPGTISLVNNTFHNNENSAGLFNFGSGLVVANSGNTANGTGLLGFVMSGSLTASQYWVKEGLPYIISDLTVPTGSELAIDAGAVIKFKGGWDRLSVLGTVNANGTASDPIYFTSIKDDTVLGDTNADGTDSSPAVSDWAHIVVLDGGTTNLSHSIVRWGGANYTGADIYNSGGTLNVADSEISHASIYGIYHTSGTTSITNSKISHNLSYGVYGTGPGTFTLTGNIFSDNDNSAGLFNFGSGLVVTNSGNTADGKGLRGLVMSGSLTSSQHWKKEGLPYIISDLTVPTGSILTIDPGAVIKFKGGWDRLSVLGTVNAIGTNQNPIYFTSIKDDTVLGDTNADGNLSLPAVSDWAHIVVLTGGNATFDHSFILYGGANYTGANLYNSGGTLSVSNSQISFASIYGIYHTGGMTTLYHNSIKNNVSYGVYNSTATDIDATNTYWGSESGPYNPLQNGAGTGNRVSDHVLFDPWLHTDPIGEVQPPTPTEKTPILFIPGIMGTEISKGSDLLWVNIPNMLKSPSDSFMDPLAFNLAGTPSDTSVTVGQVIGNPEGRFDYTEGLVSEFLSRGYSTDTEFFMYPYDWRADIANNADVALKKKIEDIAGGGKIDIIAHSQGGLLVKKFLLNHPEDNAKIRKIVFIGTPNLGAPKAAKVLLSGDTMGVQLGVFGLSPIEVKNISQNMPSVYELLPSREYFSHSSGYLGKEILHRTYTENVIYDYDTTKSTLLSKGLNSALINNAENFHSNALDNFSFAGTGIDVWNIVGCQTATVMQVIEKNPRFSVVKYDAGDETVPFFSAAHIGGATNLYALKANHSTMPSDPIIRAQVADILTGDSIQTRSGLTANANLCKISGMSVSVHSPADLNVYDPEGHHLGPNPDGTFDADIPGVAYDIIGEEKFAFLPELPSGQNYTVKLIATGSGSMSFVSEKVEESTTVNTAAYYDVPITVGSSADISLTDANTQPLVLKSSDGTSQNILPSIGTGDALPDTLAPQTTATSNGTLGKNGWYTSDVTVALKATDLPNAVSSGVYETRYSLNSGTTWSTSTPLVISTEGTTTVQYYSIDNAGNKEATSTLVVKIDKIAPEAKTSVDATTKDLKIEGVDMNPTIITKDAGNTYTITDLAGHTTKLFFQKTFLGKLLTFAKLTGVQYDTATKVTLPSSSFLYLWNPLVNPPILLSQTIVVNNIYGIEAVYNKKKNQTTILLKNKGVQIQKQIFTGLRIVKLTTNKSVVGYEI